LLAQFHNHPDPEFVAAEEDWMLTHTADLKVSHLVDDGLEDKISADIEVMKMKISNPDSNSAIITMVKMLDVCAKAITGIFPIETARTYYEKIAVDYKSKMAAHDPQAEFLTVAEHVLDVASKKSQAIHDKKLRDEQELHDKITHLQHALNTQKRKSMEMNSSHAETIAQQREQAWKIQQQFEDQLRALDKALILQQSKNQEESRKYEETLAAERAQTQTSTTDLQNRFMQLEARYISLNDSHVALNYRYQKNHTDLTKHIAESTKILDEVKKLQIQLNAAQSDYNKASNNLRIAEIDFGKLIDQRNDAATENDEILQDIENMSVALDTLTKDKTSQKTLIDDLTTRVTRLTESLLGKEDLIKQLEEANRELEGKLEASAGNKQLHVELISKLRAELMQATGTIKDLQQALSESQLSESAKDNKIATLEARLESSEDHIKELQEQRQRKPVTVTGKHGDNRNCVFSSSDIKKQKMSLREDPLHITRPRVKG
jgi:chromosome segregation ATPase